MTARARLQLSATYLGTSKTFERKFKRVVDGLAVEAVRAMQPEMDKRLNTFPGPVRRPIRWTTDKMRRAFFATNGFGRGIPTQRSGKVLAWRLVYRPNPEAGGGPIVLENPTPYAKYVFGGMNQAAKPQQPMHAATGYPKAVVEKTAIFAVGQESVRAGFADALQAFGAFTTEVQNK